MEIEKLLTISDVAEILGIAPATAKIWASRRKFPVIKIGRLVRISPQALQEWIKRNTELNAGETTNSKPIVEHRQRKRIRFEDAIKNL